MKKILMLFMVSLSTTAAFSQVEQGKFLFGGGMGISFSKNKAERPVNNTGAIQVTETRANSLSFNPKVGYLISDAFALGLDLETNTTTNKDKNNNAKSQTSYLAIGPFARYYFPQNLFLEGKVGFGSGKGNVYGNEEYRILTYSVGAGFAAFLNDHVALEPIVRYVGTNYKLKSNEAVKNKNGELQIVLALQIYL